MKRRELLAAASLLALLPAVSRAATAKPLSPLLVAKALLFTCPICRAAEGFDPAIEKALKAVGGKFVPAPLPLGNGARERMYYAARALGDKYERAVRDSLYKGTQDASVLLDDEIQVMVWLQTDLGETLDIDWGKLVDAAMSSEAKAAISRAARLAVTAAVSDVPAYIFIRDGEILESADPARAQGGSTGALRELVLQRIQALTQTKKG